MVGVPSEKLCRQPLQRLGGSTLDKTKRKANFSPAAMFQQAGFLPKKDLPSQRALFAGMGPVLGLNHESRCPQPRRPILMH